MDGHEHVEPELLIPPYRFVHLWTRWAGGRATSVEVARLRTIFPSLKSYSIARVTKIGSPRLHLGRYRLVEARELCSRAAAKGIAIEVEDE